MPRRIDMKGMTRDEWRRRYLQPLQPLFTNATRCADMPKPIDEDQLEREALAGRELMKELQ